MSHEQLAARVADEIRLPEVPNSGGRPPEARTARPGAMQFAVGVLAVIAVVLAVLFWRRESSWQDLQQQYVELQRVQEETRLLAARGDLETGRRLTDLERSAETATAVALESLEWAANETSRYGIGDLPMDDLRLSVIRTLTGHLMALGFRGVVRVESHVGDFCVSFTGPDGYQLAPPELPVTRCDQIGFLPGQAYEMGLRQSVAFANFVYQAEERTGGAIRYEIVSLGNSNPLRGYPPIADDVTAAAWNEIAASNNRVDISLLPDAM